MPTSLRRLALASVLLTATATTSLAQGCASGTFWKRDTLPDVPSLAAVSIIPGLCEGESAGVVFEMPASMSVQRITQVVAPWGAPGGVNGQQALLDIEVYDGVSFSGANVNMGTRVFSLSQAAQANFPVQSHALNTFDTTPYSIIVGSAPPTGTPAVRRFAICFRVDVNLYPGGSCATGWFGNFFTDNSQSGFGVCNNAITPQRTSVIEIQGQGWRDASLASVSGFPLCPTFYSGIWCIRCCSEDAFPAIYSTFGPGCANTLGVTHLLPATLPRVGQNLFVLLDNLPYNLALMITGGSNTFSGAAPLPLDVSFLGLPGCSLRVSFDVTQTLTGGGTTASYLLPIPNQSPLLGLQLFQQAFVLDPLLNAFGGSLSDAALLQIGS